MDPSWKKRLVGIVSTVCVGYFGLRYHGRVHFGHGIIMNWHFKFRGPGRLYIGNNVNLWAHEEPNRFFTYAWDATIRIGSHTRLNGVTCQSKKSVVIGERCAIGSAILIDTDFHSTDAAHRNDADHVKSEPITIGDDVWLAGQCAVLKGVTIGEKAVVGFRAVVASDVEANTVVAGNPARVIKNL